MKTLNSPLIRRTTIALFSVILAISFVPLSQARAESLEELAQKVEETSSAYNEALAEQQRLSTEIEDITKKITELEEKMPELTERANDALVSLYKQGNTTNDLLNALLGMTSLSQAIKYWEDYNKIVKSNTDMLEECVNAKRTLEADKEQLEADKAAQDEAVATTKEAYDDAVQARTAAQAAARAQSSGSSFASAIDWNMPKDEFVEHWGSRINNYLRGTVLSGYGETFADAAYQYGVDPRWSPAISRIESGCGAACFRPHNAWGWMGQSFGDWTTAIYAHVKYLSGPLYGGYLTMSGAATYCPPGGDWYYAVAAEMNRI